jgi:hypothetical protein
MGACCVEFQNKQGDQSSVFLGRNVTVSLKRLISLAQCDCCVPNFCLPLSSNHRHKLSDLTIHLLPIMSLSLLRTSLRSGSSRGLVTSALVRSKDGSQPMKAVHPADVVSGHSVAPATEPETPREIAAEVVSDAPSES